MWWRRMCWNHLLQDSDEQIVQHCRHNMIQLSTPLVPPPKVPASLVPMLFSLASCWSRTESSRPGGGGRCGVTCTPHSSLSHLWNMKVNGGCYPGIGERKVGKHQPVNPQFLLVINSCYWLSLPNPEFLIQNVWWLGHATFCIHVCRFDPHDWFSIVSRCTWGDCIAMGDGKDAGEGKGEM